MGLFHCWCQKGPLNPHKVLSTHFFIVIRTVCCEPPEIFCMGPHALGRISLSCYLLLIWIQFDLFDGPCLSFQRLDLLTA
uniref:Uncharacterized protein n=1 Tax=Lepeophtheirus salmonis TaxID=72036 RepID=A0A0K2UNR3_LEPSM